MGFVGQTREDTSMGKYKGVDTVQTITKDNAVALADCGVSFVGRYLVPSKYSKALTDAEASTILSSGLGIALIFEIDAARARKGETQGKLDGESVKALAYEMDVPNGTAIYFAVDYDAPTSDYPAIESYLYAAKKSVYPYRCGVYGKADLINSVKADCYMQCVAWSGGVLSKKANIYQYEWQAGAEAQKIKKRAGVVVDMDTCDDLVSAGLWLPETKDKTLDRQIEDATKWAKSVGIIVDGMHDIGQTCLAIYNYYKVFSPEDRKSESGLLS